jgi:hypothetical protein
LVIIGQVPPFLSEVTPRKKERTGGVVGLSTKGGVKEKSFWSGRFEFGDNTSGVGMAGKEIQYASSSFDYRRCVELARLFSLYGFLVCLFVPSLPAIALSDLISKMRASSLFLLVLSAAREEPPPIPLVMWRYLLPSFYHCINTELDMSNDYSEISER